MTSLNGFFIEQMSEYKRPDIWLNNKLTLKIRLIEAVKDYFSLRD